MQAYTDISAFQSSEKPGHCLAFVQGAWFPHLIVKLLFLKWFAFDSKFCIYCELVCRVHIIFKKLANCRIKQGGIIVHIDACLWRIA